MYVLGRAGVRVACWDCESLGKGGRGFSLRARPGRPACWPAPGLTVAEVGMTKLRCRDDPAKLGRRAAPECGLRDAVGFCVFPEPHIVTLVHLASSGVSSTSASRNGPSLDHRNWFLRRPIINEHVRRSMTSHVASLLRVMWLRLKRARFLFRGHRVSSAATTTTMWGCEFVVFLLHPGTEKDGIGREQDVGISLKARDRRN
ncbi:hypothetical protein LZ31DRAFT_288024 [Colletotrichum somersetense]|nr:hypothetical protein LZ31DRAFT_288024 [Colletotrichum somersetense]